MSGQTLPEAYHAALRLLQAQGELTPCPDYHTNQKELSLTFVVEEPLGEPLISKLFMGGFRELEQYRQELLDGILDFEIEKGNWAYTYHSRMAAQLPLLEQELRRNPDTRRAVIDVRDWQHDLAPGNENPACLQHLQFFIRSGRLHLKVLFRSNDACKATFMNAFALIMLQQRLAERLGVELGSYTHRANSFHCYERDFALLEGYIRRLDSGEPVTYHYLGDWDGLMDEARPEIAQAVQKLRQGK